MQKHSAGHAFKDCGSAYYQQLDLLDACKTWNIASVLSFEIVLCIALLIQQIKEH